MKERSWFQDVNQPRQHWLYVDRRTRGLVYELKPNAFSVYGEDYDRNPFARNMFRCVMPTLDEAKGLLQTIVGSQL